MVDDCGPLCHFGDRLYFTTFAEPAPVPAQLNVRGRNFKPPRHRYLNHSGPIDDAASYYFFQVESELLYLSFFQDWGPLNLSMVYKACILIHELLEDEELKPYKLVLYSSTHPHKKANSALLMALYVMIVQKKAPWEAFQPIAEVEFMPFRDAGRGRSDFNLSIQDCLWGMWRGMQNGLLDMNEFNIEDYEFYEKVENGDWNWMTPSFIAFASPVERDWNKESEAPGRKLPNSFLNCLEYFEKNSVKLVVRLNNMLYDKQHFLDRGIQHEELYFDDGTNPTDEIVRRFINLSDEVVEAGGAIAVHCKAGLGRTGTLIGAYLIWKYGFTAHEAIAFMRIVRPGSVVGPQQQYMYARQTEWMKWAAIDDLRRTEAQAAAAVAAAAIVAPATPPAEADEEEIMDVGTVETMTATVVVAPATPKAAIPPVTPNKAASKAVARTRMMSPPGQPRKTPLGKRTSTVAHVGDSDESNGSADELDALPPLTSSRPRARTQPSQPDSSVSSGRRPDSEQRPTRLTRAAAAAAASRSGRPRTPPPMSPTKGAGAGAKPSPNKIPRLARAASPQPPRPPSAMALRSMKGAVPSRLPTLIVNTRRTNGSTTAKTGSGKEGSEKEKEKDAWMKNNTSAVVKPGTKSERPGLRSIRRRRSSFSAADVVA